MARPRKPTAELELNGAFKQNPSRKRARANEPAPNGPIGPAPKYFDEEHRAIWSELVDESPLGVLTKADRKVLELTSRLVCKMRFAERRNPDWLEFLARALDELGMGDKAVKDMKDAFHTVMGTSTQEATLLARCLSQLGMTPADRSKVSGTTKKPDEDEDDIFGAVARDIRPN